jgi:hypothetical protein
MNTVQCTIRIYLLQQRLTNDEVLAVAYEYTIGVCLESLEMMV